MLEQEAPPSEAEAAPAEQEPIGPYQKSVEELIKQLRIWYKEAADAKSDITAKRHKDYRHLNGDQWEETAKKLMEAGNRPALTLNMLLTIIAAVEGEERTNRQEIMLYGEGQEDDGAAHGLNRLVKWVMNQCGGEFSLSAMFRAGIIAGQGWVVPEVDYFDDPEGKIKLVEVDDDEIFEDPLDKCPTGSGMRYLNRVRMMGEDEGEARWPGFRDRVRHRVLHDTLGPETDGSGAPRGDIYLDQSNLKSPKLYDAEKKLWAVVETWWTQIEPGWVVVDEVTGQLVEKTDAEFEALKIERQQQQMAYLTAAITGRLQATQAPAGVPAANADPANPAMGLPAPMPMPQMPKPIDAKQRPIRRIYQAFWAYDALLEKRACPVRELKRIPYVRFGAMWDKLKKEFYGLLRQLIDPQKQHNVEQSVVVQLMQLMPKQAWMAPKGGFHNKREWEEKIAKPGAMLEYNPQRGKPEPVPAPVIPRHLVDMAATRPAAMREICGVNVEMQGVRQGGDPAIAMEMRSKAAKTVLAPIFDNYRQSKIQVGGVVVGYIQTYVPKGRKVRVLGDEAVHYVEMTDQMQLQRFDLKVDEANATVNDRIATLNIMQTTLPQMMKAGMTIPPEFIDLLPMPPHIRSAFKRQMTWQLTISGQLPPPWWQPGMDPNAPPLGAVPGLPGAAPAAAPASPPVAA